MLLTKYSYGDQSKACSTHEREIFYRAFIIKHERKKSLGRQRHIHICEGDIKMELEEIVWEVMNWINLPQDRQRWRDLVITVMNLRVPLNAEKETTS